MSDRLISLYLPSLRGGGAERVMVNLARGFAERGHKVDLVLAKAEGPYLADVPVGVRVVDLKASRVLASLPGLVRYLRRERPVALLSAMGHANIVALWATRLAGVPTRVVVSIHNTSTVASRNARQFKGRLTPYFVRRFYPLADNIVAVSKGVAEDQARAAGLPLTSIKVIYKLDALKNFGLTGPESVEYTGGNAKMNEFQAAMGICNLRHIDDEIAKRRIVVERYRERLSGIRGIRLCVPQPGVSSNYAYFPVVFDGYKLSRDEVAARLKVENIYARKYFYPLTSSFKCYRGRFDAGDTPVARYIAERVLTLPLYADLGIDDVDRICDIVLR